MEIWKDIPGYEGLYEMSVCGKVKSLNYRRTGKIHDLKCVKHNSGYYYVNLVNNKGIKKVFFIHQLMGMSFLGFTPNRHELVVDHINNKKTDNRLENLQIITHRENCTKDKKRNLPTGVGFLPKRKKSYNSRIRINGKRVSLGYFLTPEEASEAYQKHLKLIEKS
jgi:hypothetical protein